MTIDEQIKEAAIGRYGNNGNGFQSMLAKVQACIVGSRYADQNPQKVYVVVRQEEHNDYVEKVFVNKEKAYAYCKQFENNPNEYGRDIEEMEITL